MMTRSPESGSTRSSGTRSSGARRASAPAALLERLLHRHVVDALLDELGALLQVAAARVKGARPQLRVQGDAARSRGNGLALRLLENRRPEALSPQLRLHGHPGEARDVTLEHKPAGAHHVLVLDGHEMSGLRVAPVAVRLRPHPLLDGEDALAQPQRGVDLLGRLGGPHFQNAQLYAETCRTKANGAELPTGNPQRLRWSR